MNKYQFGYSYPAIGLATCFGRKSKKRNFSFPVIRPFKTFIDDYVLGKTESKQLVDTPKK